MSGVDERMVAALRTLPPKPADDAKPVVKNAYAQRVSPPSRSPWQTSCVSAA